MSTRYTIGVAALALAACATPPKKKDIFWPDPPETPRIRFVDSFSNQDTFDDSGWNRFKRSILGGTDPAQLSQPMGLALTEDGRRLYIADFGAQRVFRADLKDRSFTFFAPGQSFLQPFGVAVDAAETVYVSDSGAKTVAAFNSGGDKLWSAGRDLERPTGLCLDRARSILYVVDSGTQSSQNHRVFAYDTKGNRLREIGSGRGVEDTQFQFPVYCAVAADGRLFVGDTMNFRIQIFDPSGLYLGKYGENGDGPGDFARIKGIDFDSFGNAYVSDGAHSAVQIFNKDWDVLMAFGGYAPYVEYFDIPSCVAIDRKSNRIYVCNEHNPRVNSYDLVNTTAADMVKPKPEEVEPASPRPPPPPPAR